MLRAEQLIFTYRDGDTTRNAVDGVSIQVLDRQFIGILGPSGSGKSSLLYLLSGLRKPTRGEVFLDEHRFGNMSNPELVALRRNTFGFVFQQHFLINYLTALENVMVAAPEQNEKWTELSKSLLVDLGLENKTHRFPYELSGGERQRVATARAMVHRPRIIFADEPTGMLDQSTGLQVMSLLQSYCRQGSLVVVTHDPDILDEADQVITMRDGGVITTVDRTDNKKHKEIS